MLYRPYEYQKTAEQWVVDKKRCCLFLDMGLGKSVITLTAVQDLIDYCEVRSALQIWTLQLQMSKIWSVPSIFVTWWT